MAYTTFKGQVLISANTLCLSEIISIFLFLILDVSRQRGRRGLLAKKGAGVPGLGIILASSNSLSSQA